MESRIKVKATAEQMQTFFSLCNVRCYEQIKWLNDNKGRYLYNVTLRHDDEAGKLRGVHTVESLMIKFRKEVEGGLLGFSKSKLADVFFVLDALGERERLPDVLNKALKNYGLAVSKAV